MELTCIAGRKTKLLSILRRELRLSDGLVRRIKPQEPFSVNGEAAHTDRPIFPGDRVTVRFAETPPDFAPEDGELRILYEDEALLAVDKPAGLIVHPTPQRQSGTLANLVLGYYLRTGQCCSVHILTRLDRDTRGVVLYAKNAYIHALLVEALSQGLVKKSYHALVCGQPPLDEGRIELPIARLRPGSLLRCVREDGKAAVTEYRVLRRGEISLLELRPLTGRTHQLRVHCSHLGFPILGDPQYGGGEGGQRLVAKHIVLPHPLTGEGLEIVSTMEP